MSSVMTQVVEALQGVPPEVATVVLATLPIGELRGALPVALTVYEMPLLSAVFFSILGNILPVYFLLVFFERLSGWLAERSPLARRLLDYLYERTRRKLSDRVEHYGPWALALFVGVPLPVTGAWTGSLAAFVFGMPRKKAFVSILAGLLISASIVTLVTQGAVFTVRALG